MIPSSVEEGERGYHRPVMAAELLKYLGLKPGMTVMDATLGGGGHAVLMANQIIPGGELIGIDRDGEALMAATEVISRPGLRVRLIKGCFGEIKKIAEEVQLKSVDAIVADIGLSSHQLDSAGRGFSFSQDGPLDMRMDQSQGESAAELLKRLSAEELEAVIRMYGEERFAGRIARAISGRDMTGTLELASIIRGAIPPQARYGRIHPATRTFQALRIAVNGELKELEQFLCDAPALLAPGGRLAIMSYHSLEDRMVKHSFRAAARSRAFSLPVKRPIMASDEELGKNPRSRSAKLRLLERLPAGRQG